MRKKYLIVLLDSALHFVIHLELDTILPFCHQSSGLPPYHHYTLIF